MCQLQWTGSLREGQVSVPHCHSQVFRAGQWPERALGHLKGQNLVPVTATFDWPDPGTISLYCQYPSWGYTVTHLTEEDL